MNLIAHIFCSQLYCVVDSLYYLGVEVLKHLHILLDKDIIHFCFVPSGSKGPECLCVCTLYGYTSPHMCSFYYPKCRFLTY